LDRVLWELSSSLVLFDIDGTLTRGAGPHHRAALENAVLQVTGIAATTDGIPVHGMLDRVILTLMLRAAGISDAEAQRVLPAAMDAAQDLYQTGVPDLRDKLCPGLPAILEELTQRGVVLALVTGNLTRIGWHKLLRAGIGHYFRFGAFGEMAPTRGDLAKMAVERARREGLIGSDARITLIGDAASDIQAARDAGVQSIAVRTGIAPIEELVAAGPDLLLEDLTRLDLAIV
jgi:phosphoglycolate phosphatase-like HAD superfamily hydrolase